MATTTINEVTNYLESFAPKSVQEDYDNCGLLVGNAQEEVKGILLTLDCTEEVVMEAKRKDCNLIVAHHPIIFRGLKKLTGSTYVERTVMLAIKENISIYAIHTNLDNIHLGVNRKIAQKLGLINYRILAPKTDTLLKLVTFAPLSHSDAVLEALYKAGAGQIGDYKNCSFQVTGHGTFMPVGNANPHLGKVNQQEKVEERRIEVLLASHLKEPILKALKEAHPYEEVAYYLSRLENTNQEIGSGMIGHLEKPMDSLAFLQLVKTTMKVPALKHTEIVKSKISSVALCGGSGSFLLGVAKAANADIYISADFKYHEYFDAEKRIIIADIGHYESEQYTPEILEEVLKEKFTTFAINFSKTVTNPISYL